MIKNENLPEVITIFNNTYGNGIPKLQKERLIKDVR